MRVRGGKGAKPHWKSLLCPNARKELIPGHNPTASYCLRDRRATPPGSASRMDPWGRRPGGSPRLGARGHPPRAAPASGAQASLPEADTAELPIGLAKPSSGLHHGVGLPCAVLLGPLMFHSHYALLSSLVSLAHHPSICFQGHPPDTPGALNSCRNEPSLGTPQPTPTVSSALTSEARVSSPGAHEGQGGTVSGGHSARGLGS